MFEVLLGLGYVRLERRMCVYDLYCYVIALLDLFPRVLLWYG